MRWVVKVSSDANDELVALRAYDYARVKNAIRSLETVAALGKVITATVPGWGEPVRQIRAGDYRIYYSIDDGAVLVHAVRRKGTRTTGEILR